MTDFDYDVMQKKRIARGATHKKNGSKIKSCRLSSDGITRKQWKEKCGLVESYNYGGPMGWKAFKKMPIDIQKEYICGLVSKYNANYSALSKVFGSTPTTISAYAADHDFGLNITTGTKMNAKQKREWERFINPQKNESNDTVKVENKKAQEVAEGNDCAKKMCMKSASVEFEGAINIDDIANSLRYLIGNNSAGKVCISYTLST